MRKNQRIVRSTPWLKVDERKEYRIKVFKSGNSMALRLPAELGLEAGLEINLRVENGEIVSLEPADRPKRKFNVGKVAGSGVNLKALQDGDRAFEERSVVWPRLA